ncbi:hypothetical protein BY996DRAFT_6411894 [Phakopsora pachyrhizi]|nr:hypothetical protein BY996DRAFT_6411894 [Phakopsora pachyrhizi]
MHSSSTVKSTSVDNNQKDDAQSGLNYKIETATLSEAESGDRASASADPKNMAHVFSMLQMSSQQTVEPNLETMPSRNVILTVTQFLNKKFNLNLSTNLILICPIAACQLLTGSFGGIHLDHSPINSSILKWNIYYNQRASVVGFRLVPLFKTRKGVGGTTTDQSIKQHGHPEQTFPGTPTHAVILPLTSILEWNGLDDSTNTLKLEAAAIFGLLSILEASKPESRAIPEELKDNTSNNDLERDFTQEPEAFTISQDDELDKASQSLSIDAKPNRKKSSGHVISKLKKLILNHYQPSIIQK